MLSTISDSFTSSYPVWILFISFTCLIGVTSTNMLDKSVKSNFFVLDRRRNAFSCSLLSVIVTVGLSYMALIVLNFIFSVHSLLEFLILNAC